MTINIDAKDSESETGWSRVTFHMEELRRFCINRESHHVEVLSSGIQIGWVADEFVLVLDAYPDDDGQLPDLESNRAYVTTARCEWGAVTMGV